MNDRILIIEDEKGLVLSLEDRLRAEGYSTDYAYNGIEGEEKAKSGEYDLIILDIMLPDRDGFLICRNLREEGIQTPILMLTARSANFDTIMGLRVGADDYLPKPFDMQVLVARIEALLRRASMGITKGVSHSFGSFFLDTEKKELTMDGKVIPLKAQEYRLLEFFLCEPNRVISRDELLDEVWGYDNCTTSRTVDVHVSWLRQKLGEKEWPRHLLTVRGHGYKFILNP